ncbi:hypothetical protein N7466_003638 [Penicillium verhagenii]|uniref:uncharacterized protein n=1 Tax=Penicillium verhagenii TaxID=1562060 RepID=UPI0025453E68|nr:uncharacterized protein N7466_003638 [Penicillium verhagenii]KAJ5934091.1 hypothetical protein N7466_003638 [Penicillium verhagenii]
MLAINISLPSLPFLFFLFLFPAPPLRHQRQPWLSIATTSDFPESINNTGLTWKLNNNLGLAEELKEEGGWDSTTPDSPGLSGFSGEKWLRVQVEMDDNPRFTGESNRILRHAEVNQQPKHTRRAYLHSGPGEVDGCWGDLVDMDDKPRFTGQSNKILRLTEVNQQHQTRRANLDSGPGEGDGCQEDLVDFKDDSLRITGAGRNDSSRRTVPPPWTLMDHLSHF